MFVNFNVPCSWCLLEAINLCIPYASFQELEKLEIDAYKTLPANDH